MSAPMPPLSCCCVGKGSCTPSRTALKVLATLNICLWASRGRPGRPAAARSATRDSTHQIFHWQMQLVLLVTQAFGMRVLVQVCRCAAEVLHHDVPRARGHLTACVVRVILCPLRGALASLRLRHVPCAHGLVQMEQYLPCRERLPLRQVRLLRVPRQMGHHCTPCAGPQRALGTRFGTGTPVSPIAAEALGAAWCRTRALQQQARGCAV